MDGLLAAPFAPLFKLDLALDELLVFGRPIVNTLAVLAGEADQAVLRHNANNYNLQGYLAQGAPRGGGILFACQIKSLISLLFWAHCSACK